MLISVPLWLETWTLFILIHIPHAADATVLHSIVWLHLHVEQKL